jgi:hypothetical protein
MNKNTGGPAFPGSYTGNNGMPVWSNGMTLRDYFAAKAMQGEVSRAGYYRAGNKMPHIAIDAYAMADAMLEAREK